MALQTEEPYRFQSATVISKIIKIKDLPANPCLQDSRNYQIVRILPLTAKIRIVMRPAAPFGRPSSYAHTPRVAALQDSRNLQDNRNYQIVRSCHKRQRLSYVKDFLKPS